jgi:hypothetical protein
MFASLLRKIGIRTRRGFRLFLRAAAVIFVTCCGYAIALLIDLKLHAWSILPFAVLLGSTLFEFVLGDLVAEQSYPIETEKKLALLEQRLGNNAIVSMSDMLRRTIGRFEACDTHKISATVHVVIELSPSQEADRRFGLLQLTDYVGPMGGDKGRITTLDKGIVGRCARTGKAEFVNFADSNEYRRRMVEEFGFLDHEAASHTRIARSYLAEPIKVEERVVGVLYFFSTDPQVFPHAVRNSDIAEKARDLGAILQVISIV